MGKVGEVLGAVLSLVWMSFVCGLFLVVSMIVGKRYGPGWGALTSLAEFPIANLLGVKPMPGVVQGAFCIVLNLSLFFLCLLQTLEFVRSLFR